MQKLMSHDLPKPWPLLHPTGITLVEVSSLSKRRKLINILVVFMLQTTAYNCILVLNLNILATYLNGINFYFSLLTLWASNYCINSEASFLFFVTIFCEEFSIPVLCHIIKGRGVWYTTHYSHYLLDAIDIRDVTIK